MVEDALNLLKKDAESAEEQWTKGDQFKSFLQRSDVTYADLREKFAYTKEETKWRNEYNGEGKSSILQTQRKRIAFLRSSCKEFSEEYDENITDVDFMRLLEIPYTDSKDAIDFSFSEMKEE